MKARKLNNLIATSLIGAILVGCSGGGTSSTGPGTTIPRASTNPTTNPSPVAPTIGSGPITVGMSGNEAIDDVNTKLDGIINKQNAQSQKLDEAASKLNEINKNSQDAASNSSWAKWLGVAAVSMLALPMIGNAVYNYGATGDLGKSFLAGVTNSSSEADAFYDQQRLNSQTGQVSGMIGASTAASVGATQSEGQSTRSAVRADGNDTRKTVAASTDTLVGAVADSRDSIKEDLSALTQRLNDDRATLEAQRLATAKQLSDTQRAVETMQTKVLGEIQKASDAQVQELQETMKSLKPTFDLIPGLTQDLQNQKTALENHIKTYETEKSKLAETEVAKKTAYDQQITTLKTEITSLTTKIDDLQRAHDTHIQVQSELADRLSALQTSPQAPPVAASTGTAAHGNPQAQATSGGASQPPVVDNPAKLVETGETPGAQATR